MRNATKIGEYTYKFGEVYVFYANDLKSFN